MNFVKSRHFIVWRGRLIQFQRGATIAEPRRHSQITGFQIWESGRLQDAPVFKKNAAICTNPRRLSWPIRNAENIQYFVVLLFSDRAPVCPTSGILSQGWGVWKYPCNQIGRPE
jgi:hypothetical protein